MSNKSWWRKYKIVISSHFNKFIFQHYGNFLRISIIKGDKLAISFEKYCQEGFCSP